MIYLVFVEDSHPAISEGGNEKKPVSSTSSFY